MKIGMLYLEATSNLRAVLNKIHEFIQAPSQLSYQVKSTPQAQSQPKPRPGYQPKSTPQPQPLPGCTKKSFFGVRKG